MELDSSALCNATVSVEVASKMYKAVLHSMDDKGSAGPNSTSYYLKYKKKVGTRGKAKANGWVDLELPVGEKCSWWRLDGYTTYDEDGDSTDQEAEQLANDAREDIELSLSNSEDSDSESEESASD